MLTREALPNWPPPPTEPIGEGRARDYIAWIRDHAPPLIEEGRRMIEERHDTTDTNTTSVRLNELAKWKLGDDLAGLSIGTVWAPIRGGTWAMVLISIRRDGQLEVKPGWNMG